MRTIRTPVSRSTDGSVDNELTALLDEVRGYPNVQALLDTPPQAAPSNPLLVPCVLNIAGHSCRCSPRWPPSARRAT